MPYAPGVQDITGQLRAAGIAQAGQAWGQAIGNIGKSVTDAMQTYKQNQYLTNQALGKFTAATQADPSLLKFLESGGEQEDPNAPKFPVSPELLKSWSKVKEGKPLDVRDAAMLGTMADTWVKTKQDAMQIQHINLQNRLLTQQAEQNQRMADFMKRYTTASAATGTPTDGKAAPEGIGQFAGGAGVAGGGGIKPPTEEDVVAKAIATTGKMPTQAQITAQLRQDLQEWRKGQIESREYATAELAAAAGKEALAKGIYPEGTIPVVKKNAATGSFYNETTTSSVEPAEVSARRKELETAAVAETEQAIKAENDISAAADRAIDQRSRFNRIRELYRQQVPSGPLADYTLGLRSAFADLGLGDPTKVQSEQELKALLGRAALDASREYYKGQGSVSRDERTRLEDAVESFKKGQISNEQLMSLAEAAHDKAIAAGRYQIELEKSKLTPRDRRIQMKTWWLDNPLDRFVQAAPAAPAAAGAKAKFRWDPATQKLIPL